MISFIELLGLLGLLALVSASPVAPTNERGTFKIQRVQNPNYTSRNGARALFHALQKHHMPVPDSLIQATAKSYNQSVTKRQLSKRRDSKIIAEIAQMSNGEWFDYITPINIGGQTLNTVFDTGSADMWVFNTEMDKKYTSGHTLFDKEKSHSFKLMSGSKFGITYGDESEASGNVGADTIHIGGATVTSQAFGLPTAASDSFIRQTYLSGLVGLGPSSANQIKPKAQKMLFDDMIPSLQESLFTVDFKKGTGGSYEFGAIDTTKYTGDMQWVSIDKDSDHWESSCDSYTINGRTTKTSSKVIFDTGWRIYGSVQSKLPDLQLVIDGKTVTVKGESINSGIVEVSKSQANTQTECFSGIQSSGIDGKTILGDIFFLDNFVVFNEGTNMVGFAPH